jgi:hypothetical protein
MLHHILLGIFCTARDGLFEQLGISPKAKKSQPAEQFEALTTQFAKQLKRHSVRDMPKMHFSSGILGRGRMMAKEHRGVILLLAIGLMSSKGRAIVMKRKAFQDEKRPELWVHRRLQTGLCCWKLFFNGIVG